MVDLEPAVAGDAAALAALRDEAARWLLAAGFCQWEVGEYTAEQFARSIERDDVLVVRRCSRIVSTVTIASDDDVIWLGRARSDAAYIHRLIVARSHAGQGLGRAVVAATEELMRQHGARFARLDYVAANPALGEYYHRLGYQDVGGRTFPAERGIHPCRLLEKDLTRRSADQRTTRNLL
jgi:ribosomal protein S18 acetylase RimI-like enzyme